MLNSDGPDAVRPGSALSDLIDRGPTDRDIQALFAANTFPIVRENEVTFVFRGQADAVELRHWIYGLPSNIRMARLGGSDVWYRAMQFPEGSRIEYKYGVIHGNAEQWVLDPLNVNIAHDPFGGNSVVHCTGYEVPEWSIANEVVPRGELRELKIDSRAFGDERIIQVYLPAKFRDYRRYRLLVVHDGNDYMLYSGLVPVLDNLIHRLEIPPIIVAMTNPRDRMTEYTDDARHGEHIVEELIPELQRRFPLIREASGRCLMGASLGGVASLATSWRYPESFDSLLLQSSSLAFTDIGDHWRGPAFDRVVEFMNAFRKQPGTPSKRIFMSCGVYESLIYENRSIVPFLQSHGMDVKFVESRDGHNWENWRDRLRDGLTWLFPGPLWVTYM